MPAIQHDAEAYIGSIPPMLLALAHPEIYRCVLAGEPLTAAHGDELRRCPFVFPYIDSGIA